MVAHNFSDGKISRAGSKLGNAMRKCGPFAGKPPITSTLTMFWNPQRFPEWPDSQSFAPRPPVSASIGTEGAAALCENHVAESQAHNSLPSVAERRVKPSQYNSNGGISPMAYELAPLPYDYAALEPFIDAETMKLHHDKHHQAYINNVNAALASHPKLAAKSIDDLISDLNAIPEEIRGV